MTPRPTFLAAGAAALALLFAACGDDDGGERPSAAELSDTFEEAGLEPEAADCVGEAYADSDISDGGLRTLVDADLEDPTAVSDVEVSEDDADASEAVTEQVTECIMAGVEVPEDPTATTEAEG